MAAKLMIYNNSGCNNLWRLPASGPERIKYIALLSAVFRSHLPLFALQLMRNYEIVMLDQFAQQQRFSKLFIGALLLNAIDKSAHLPALAAGPRKRADFDRPAYHLRRVESSFEHRAPPLPAPIIPLAPSVPESVPVAAREEKKESASMPAQYVEVKEIPPSYEESLASPDLNTPPTYEEARAAQPEVVLSPSYEKVFPAPSY